MLPRKIFALVTANGVPDPGTALCEVCFDADDNKFCSRGDLRGVDRAFLSLHQIPKYAALPPRGAAEVHRCNQPPPYSLYRDTTDHSTCYTRRRGVLISYHVMTFSIRNQFLMTAWSLLIPSN